MVSEEECYRTIERGGYYVICPMLPELRARMRRGAVARRPSTRRPTSPLDDARARARCSAAVHDRRWPAPRLSTHEDLTRLRHAAGDHPAEPRSSRALDRLLRARARAHRPELRSAAERHLLRASSACARPTCTWACDGVRLRRAGRADPGARRRRCSRAQRPDRVLILGDTNSGLAAIVAARMGIPVFHMEAGNRCYDDRVPEEVNRRVIDHCSTVLMPYTRAQQGEPGARGHRARAHLRDRQPDPARCSRRHRGRDRRERRARAAAA